MTIPQIAPYFGFGVLLVLSLVTTSTRNRRYLATVAAIAVVVAVAGVALTGDARRVVVIGGLAAGFALWLWPTPFHLSSFDREDLVADATMRRLFAVIGSPSDAPRIRALLPELEIGAFVVPASPWAHAATLVRLCAARAIEPEPASPEPGTSPLAAYQRAAVDFWRHAYWRRVIGKNQPPSERDEDVLLRAYWETFQRLIPTSALFVEPAPAVDGWDPRASELIGEVRGLRLGHTGSERMRRLLLESMEAHLALARGDRTEVARARQAAAVAAVRDGWRDERALAADRPG